MMKIDYNEYDSLSLYVKTEKRDEIIEHYKLFKWELFKEVLNSKYEDIVDLTFIRPHKIENKDELQLLQVYMEERINGISKLEKNKHSIATAFGLGFGVGGLVLISLALIFYYNLLGSLKLWLSITFGVVGFIFVVLFAVVLPWVIKKEKEKFSVNFQKQTEALSDICEKAKVLVGGEDCGQTKTNR